MKLIEIAKLIPAEYRKEILDLNMIANAHPYQSDPVMYQLSRIWKNYVEPGFEGGCSLCYARVLDNYKQILPYLVELEKQSNLLSEV